MIKKIAIVAAVIVLAAAGLVGYYLFRPPEEASAPIEAVPLNLEENEDNQAADAETTTEEAAPVAESENENQTEEVTETATDTEAQPESETEAAVEAEPAETVEEEAAEAAPETDPAAEQAAEATVFEILPAESEARFEIDEVLRGEPITVVGATDQVAGQLALDPNNLAATQVGTMQVNARTLATDNNFRNRAIKNAILLTDEYEFVTFNPTEISGLPDSAAPGETITFQVLGDLTVTDVTQPVTFDITATPISDTRIEGTASAAFLYTDFDLFIPDARSVDTVDDEVRLEIDFVAEATGEVAQATESEAEAASESEAVVETEAEVAEAQQETAAETATETETDSAEAQAEAETDSSEAQVAASPTVFEILPAESEARFEIDEVLRGDPVTVVGMTDQVAGQLALDPDNLASTRLGTVQVNARTLATDNNFRNRAIKNAILLTDDYEFVTFSPTEISGLPDSAAPGDTLTFQISGDLTVTDVTRPVTFDITATPISETRIEATASTAFLYTDFELFIPDAPAVNTVDDEVRLEIDFVAEAVSEVAG